MSGTLNRVKFALEVLYSCEREGIITPRLDVIGYCPGGEGNFNLRPGDTLDPFGLVSEQGVALKLLLCNEEYIY